jgi:transposase
MRVTIERCRRLDVHKETVVSSDRRVRGSTEEGARPFHTVTRDLEALREWLAAAGVMHVGMESTGVYWRPVYAVLEGHC